MKDPYKIYASWYDTILEPFNNGLRRIGLKMFPVSKGMKVLDIGCGTGRHCIELTQRGYSVIGIDLSASQLQKAKEKAELKNLHIDFFRYDARKLPFVSEFDVAIMICEGAFPLMETDEMNYEIPKKYRKVCCKQNSFLWN